MSSRYDGLQKIIDEALRSMAAEIEKGSTSFTTVHALRDGDRTIVGYRELDFWNQESMGTQKFFEVAVPIIDALENGKAIFIDEYGSFIHPTLSGAILALFEGKKDNGAYMAPSPSLSGR